MCVGITIITKILNKIIIIGEVKHDINSYFTFGLFVVLVP